VSWALEAVVAGATELSQVPHPFSILIQILLLLLSFHTLLFSCFDTRMVSSLIRSVPSLKARYRSEFHFFTASVLVLDFEHCRYL
jgi:hypothetical protein